jgi:hypothetical protein
MSMNFRSDGVLVAWFNDTSIPRRKTQLVIDNKLIGYAMEDIAPGDDIVWREDRIPIFTYGTICRCGMLEYSIHLIRPVQAWQAAYYNEVVDVVTDSPGATSSIPFPAAGNVGIAAVSAVAVSDETRTEQWILECLTNGPNSRWRIAGSYSGTLSDNIQPGVWYYGPNRIIGFQITENIGGYSHSGDRYTWYTTAARTRVGIFMNDYYPSETYGEILLDRCKTPLKRSIHGKFYR